MGGSTRGQESGNREQSGGGGLSQRQGLRGACAPEQGSWGDERGGGPGGTEALQRRLGQTWRLESGGGNGLEMWDL